MLNQRSNQNRLPAARRVRREGERLRRGRRAPRRCVTASQGGAPLATAEDRFLPAATTGSHYPEYIRRPAPYVQPIWLRPRTCESQRKLAC